MTFATLYLADSFELQDRSFENVQSQKLPEYAIGVLLFEEHAPMSLASGDLPVK
jgi:hypothetical protein